MLHIIAAHKRGPATNLQIITLTYALLFAVAVCNYGLTKHLGHNILLHYRDPEHSHG